MARLASLTTHALDYNAGSVCRGALAFGDADGDGAPELAIGSTSGALALFKGPGAGPCCTLRGLGAITAIAIGPLGPLGGRRLVALTAEGIGYVIEVLGDDAGGLRMRERAHPLPPHASAALIADVDGDGEAELIAAFFDGEVCAYRLGADCLELHLVSRWHVGADPRSLSLTATSPPRVLVGTADGVVAIDATAATAADGGGARLLEGLGEGLTTIVFGELRRNGAPAIAIARDGVVALRLLEDGRARAAETPPLSPPPPPPLAEFDLGEQIVTLLARPAADGRSGDADALLAVTSSGVVAVVGAAADERALDGGGGGGEYGAAVGEVGYHLGCELVACTAGAFGLGGASGAAAATRWCLAYVVAPTNELFLAHPALPAASVASSALELLRGGAEPAAARGDDGDARFGDDELRALVRAALAAARARGGPAVTAGAG